MATTASQSLLPVAAAAVAVEEPEICAALFAAEEPAEFVAAEFMAPVESDALELPGAPVPDAVSGPEL